MNSTTKSFINLVNLLKRRQEDIEKSNQELEMLNSVSSIFSKNQPMILSVHTQTISLETNNVFIQAANQLENYHIEQDKIEIENTRLLNMQKEINAARNKLTARRTINNKLRDNLFVMFNTNTQENFVLTPHMQITFK